MRPSRDPDLISAFAAAIKARRLELGLTQEDLAGRIEIDRPFITLMESATKQPSISVLWRLAIGLDLTAAQLCSLVEDRLDRAPSSSRNHVKDGPPDRSAKTSRRTGG